MFRTAKPLIGMVHLMPLPGSPRYDDSGIEPIIEHAMQDASALANGGVDGLLIENYGDIPFKPITTDPETVASVTVIAKEIVKEVNLPLGVNILRNSGLAALAVCMAVGGRFIRVNVLTEASVTDQGIIQGCAHDLQRYRKQLSATNIRIFADIHCKHAIPLQERPLKESAQDAAYRGMADALIVTGSHTGAEPRPSDIEEIKEAVPDRPVIIGSGLHPGNARRLLDLADGAIVGTSLKKDGITENPVDEKRVKELVNVVRALR
jgi:hypothetical protein